MARLLSSLCAQRFAAVEVAQNLRRGERKLYCQVPRADDLPMSLGRIIAAVAISVSVAATPASATPPRTATITSTGALNRHVTARWTLPPNVEPFVVEVARTPDVEPDGGFFTENVVGVGLLQAGQTSVIMSEQLDPGFYYLHVLTIDADCSRAEDDSCAAWSPAAQVTVPHPPNGRPTLRFVRWVRASGDARMRACRTVATACHRLPFGSNGKEGVEGSSHTFRTHLRYARRIATFRDAF
jgi:hypothetical protein